MYTIARAMVNVRVIHKVSENEVKKCIYWGQCCDTMSKVLLLASVSQSIVLACVQLPANAPGETEIFNVLLHSLDGLSIRAGACQS